MSSVEIFFLILGASFAVTGIVLFAKMGTGGENTLKLLGMELRITGSALVIFVLGVVLMILVLPEQSGDGQRSSESSSAGTVPDLNSVSSSEPSTLPSKAHSISLTEQDVHLTHSNIVEELKYLGFKDIDIASNMRNVIDALAHNGVTTKGQLVEVVKDQFAMAKLKQIYVEELGRNPSFPLDPLAVAAYGTYLHRHGVSEAVVDAIRQSVRMSNEYQRRRN